MKKLFIVFLPVLLLSCAREESDVTEIDKNGSIEITTSTRHLDNSNDVASYTINYYKGGHVIKTTIISDTIPSLGIITETLENEEGEEKSITHLKDYNVFVTIK